MSDAGDTDEGPPSATVYAHNLNEKVKIPALIEAIREIFAEFGEIIEIVAKKNIRAKGQAFIVYSSPDEAKDAIDLLNGFELLGKELKLEFAKTRSDATVQREDDEQGLEEHKKHRLAAKERRQAEQAAEATQAKRQAADALAERPAKKPAAPAGLVPAELLPPNKILILQDVPEDYSKELLTALWSRFPGFKEVRTVPGRIGLAFVEYENEESSAAAKEALGGVELSGQKIKVTFQRQ